MLTGSPQYRGLDYLDVIAFIRKHTCTRVSMQITVTVRQQRAVSSPWCASFTEPFRTATELTRPNESCTSRHTLACTIHCTRSIAWSRSHVSYVLGSWRYRCATRCSCKRTNRPSRRHV
jgi:hypothetical protein